MNSTSPKSDDLNLSYLDKPQSPICSPFSEKACVHHVHELTQMSNGHVYGHFRIWGLPDSECVSLVYFLPSLWKTCTPGLNIAHFRELELLSHRRVSHHQPGQRFPLGAEARRMGTLASSCLLSLVTRPFQTADKCSFFSLFCLLCLFPFQKAPYFIC